MTSTTLAPSRGAWNVNSGALEAMKWIGVVSMLIDHINYVFATHSPIALIAGRLAFPLFAFVFAYNLATGDRERLKRGMNRWVAAGVVSQIPYYLVFEDALRLNIFFTFLLAATLIYMRPEEGAKRMFAAVALWAIGGSFVDYFQPGVAVILALYYALQPHRPTAERVMAVTAGFLLLSAFSMSAIGWPGVAVLAAWPLIVAINTIRPAIARTPWAFYVIYPVHLAALSGIAALLQTAP